MKKRDEAQSAREGTAARPSPADAVWQPRGGGFGARAIATLVPRITQKSFEKHGFAAASLIMDWPQIVGRALARDTRPLKLKWPRGVDTYAETDEASAGRPGATLVIQVDPAVALDIQYQSEQIIDRINAYFGYRAVASLRLLQEPIEQAADADRAAGINAAPDAGQTRAAEPSKSTQENDPLAAALSRLGAHIRAQGTRGGRG